MASDEELEHGTGLDQRRETTEKGAQLDHQPISEETGRQIVLLREYLGIHFETASADLGQDDDALTGLREWYEGALADLPQQTIEGAIPEIARTYTTVPISSTSGGRTYWLNLQIDNAFGSTLVSRIRTFTQTMLDRVIRGNTTQFISNARASGLTYRRNRSMPFPHPLPYASPPPTTLEGRAAEEVAIIEAAWSYPASHPRPGMNLAINQFDKQANGNLWVTGQATVNLYNDRRILRIELNRLALRNAGFSNAIWSGTVAHEVLHNLGWGHPDGNYNRSIAMVNYERCIRTARAIADEGDVYFVR